MTRTLYAEYRGVLKKPICAGSKADAQRQFDERIVALAQYFGLNLEDPDAFKRLAYSLAFRHVPGFNLGRRTGKELRRAFSRRLGRSLASRSHRHQEDMSGLLQEIGRLAAGKSSLHGAITQAVRNLSRRGQPFQSQSHHTTRKQLERFCRAHGLTPAEAVQQSAPLQAACHKGCFGGERFVELDLDAIVQQCREPSGCELRQQAVDSQEHIKRAITALRSKIDIVNKALDELERLRSWVWPSHSRRVKARQWRRLT